MKKIFFTSLALFSTAILFAQEKAKDTLSTDEIIVVKPYTPTISDAFKIKDTPKIEKDTTLKESIDYTFFYVPVASTFTPTKGKAQSVVREPIDKIYENFVAAGFGNYTTPYLEAFLHTSSSRNNDFGAFVKHQSSGGGIKDILVDDNYSDSQIALFYKQFERDYNWEANFGAQYQIYNWYGLSEDIIYDPNFLTTIDPKQNYLTIFGGGKFNFEKGIFKGGKLDINYFSDDYNSSEIQVKMTPKVAFPISSEVIDLPFDIEYITGSFKQNYTTDTALEYSFLNLGASPSLEILRDKLTVNLGAKIYFSFDLENSTNTIYAYPNVTASYKLIDETVIGYGGVTGDLYQNSYREFAQDNPFISPTLNIIPTDQQYNAFLGAKGKLSSKVGYNFKASYQSEKNKALYIQNPTTTDGTTLPSYAYQAGNSFNVVYDNLTTLSFYGAIDVTLSKEFNLSADITYNNLTTDTQEKAWYTPTLKATTTANYNREKWYIGTDIYFVGEQYDFVQKYGEANASVTSIDPYVDINFNGGYVFTDRLTAFGKVNNVLGANYDLYTNYRVQGIQVLAGVIYKFDL